MKKVKSIIRQGDITLVPADEPKTGKASSHKSFILAYGEATGHRHELMAFGGDIEVIDGGSNSRYVKVPSGGAVLVQGQKEFVERFRNLTKEETLELIKSI